MASTISLFPETQLSALAATVVVAVVVAAVVEAAVVVAAAVATTVTISAMAEMARQQRLSSRGLTQWQGRL